ncbi:MAG: nucleotidyltransferase family protein [archaeon]|nr:nucleotidyltransferase family protein [archaeon]MCP8314399.1 nucleotidyltransferase family protein [archaeon]
MVGRIIVIILAGGYAKRLWPLTREKPKPLLPVSEKPIIEYIIEKLSTLYGIERIIISTNLRFESCFREWLATTGYQHIEIATDNSRSEEEKPGAVKALAELTSKIHSDCLIMAGDNLFTADLKGMINLYKKKSSPVIALYNINNLNLAKHYATVLLDQDNKIADFEEKPSQPKTTLIGTCIYILPERTLPRLREYVGKDLGKDQPGRFIEWLHKNEPVYGYILEGYWWDIGTLESYIEADKFFLSLGIQKSEYQT